nr:hypothetical protein [Mucilaginibacter sp. FT3.2]
MWQFAKRGEKALKLSHLGVNEHIDPTHISSDFETY